MLHKKKKQQQKKQKKQKKHKHEHKKKAAGLVKKGKRILVLGMQSRPQVAETIEELRPVLEAVGEVEVQDLHRDWEKCGVPPAADLAIVVGGDGSILRASRCLAPAGIACMGVNTGRLGFLASFQKEEVAAALPEVLQGRGRREERMMLSVRIEKHTGDYRDETALNDVLISHGARHRMIGVVLDVDGQSVATFHGDGALVATPTGSTGHNLAADGPILEARLEAMVVTPVCPHTLSNRSIVIAGGARVRLRLAPHEQEATCIVDGQVQVSLVQGDVVHIERAAHRFMLVENWQRTAYDTLREKLHWSQGPRYNK